MELKHFVPEKTAAYIDQYDLHVPEMTVRETIDFSARFQGVGNRAGYYTTILTSFVHLINWPAQCLQIKLIGNHSFSVHTALSLSKIMKEVIRREKVAGITPDPNVDTYMKVKH